jgi:Protein of unknown function (DUF992)
VFKNYALMTAVTLIAMLPVSAIAQTPPSWVQTGMLTCKLNSGIGVIIAGHQSMECRFIQKMPFPPEDYQGVLNTIELTSASPLGVCSAGQCTHPPSDYLQARYPANMSGPAATSALVLEWEPTSSSADPGARSPCSHSP